MTAVFIPKQRLKARETLYSPPPSHARNSRVTEILTGPGSRRNITSPKLTRSNWQFSLRLILNGVLNLAFILIPSLKSWYSSVGLDVISEVRIDLIHGLRWNLCVYRGMIQLRSNSVVESSELFFRNWEFLKILSQLGNESCFDKHARLQHHSVRSPVRRMRTEIFPIYNVNLCDVAQH